VYCFSGLLNVPPPSKRNSSLEVFSGVLFSLSIMVGFESPFFLSPPFFDAPFPLLVKGPQATLAVYPVGARIPPASTFCPSWSAFDLSWVLRGLYHCLPVPLFFFVEGPFFFYCQLLGMRALA